MDKSPALGFWQGIIVSRVQEQQAFDLYVLASQARVRQGLPRPQEESAFARTIVPHAKNHS